MERLNAAQGRDFGFGEQSGFDSTLLDTADALEALFAAGGQQSAAAWDAVRFLIDRQAVGGGWGDGGVGRANPYVSARVMAALTPIRGRSAAVGEALRGAESLLLAWLDTDGAQSSLLDRTVVMLALLPNLPDPAPLDAQIRRLRTAQDADGSWQEQVYLTALALRLIRLYDAQVAASTSNGGTASIFGRLLGAAGAGPLVGATVRFKEVADATVSTDAEGRFDLSGIVAGRYTLELVKIGYQSRSEVVELTEGQATPLGDFTLLPREDLGSLHGRVVAAADGAALSGVSVLLQGDAEWRVTTAEDGAFELAALPAGHYRLLFSTAGYAALGGGLDIAAGEVLLATARLSTEGYFDDTPLTLRGVAVDGASGVPVAGAWLRLDGGATARSDAQGRFTLAGVTRGDYRATLEADGYQGVVIALNLSPAAVGEMGEIQLFPLAQGVVPDHLDLEGEVVDAVDGRAVAGASVAVIDGGVTSTSDARGRFVLAGLSTTRATLSVAADGYRSAQAVVSAAGFGTMRVTVPLPPADSSVALTGYAATGVVVDGESGSPLAGATVTADAGGAPLSVLTASDGRYLISGVASGEVWLEYTSETYQRRRQLVRLALGAVSELGRLALYRDGEPLPDLAIDALSSGTLDADPGTLSVEGRVGVTVSNHGMLSTGGPVRLLAFYDNDADGRYREQADDLFGETAVGVLAAGARQEVEMALAGALPFRGAPLHFMVDADDRIAEGVEGNNVVTSASQCRVAGGAVADLALSLLRYLPARGDTPPQLRVRVGNGGAVVTPAGVDVSFYEGDPAAGGRLLGSVPIPEIVSGGFFDLRFDGFGELLADVELYAVADLADTLPECNEQNNVATAPAPLLRPDAAVVWVDGTALPNGRRFRALTGRPWWVS
ncbi:carboxypeptidase regulatory-like domain-containing protein [Endothiovibrio diazotrophicus]